MKYNISKELLCEVLDKDKGSITKIENSKSKTIVEYEQFERYWGAINIYELAHKCKKWAFDQGCELFSRIISNDHQMRGNCLIIRVESDPEYVLKVISANSETEAIFLACEWVFQNKG